MKESIFEENSNWQTERRLDPKSGDIHDRYYYKGRRAYKLKLESHQVNHLNGWYLIIRDLHNIKAWLRLLNSELLSSAHTPNQQERFQYSTDEPDLIQLQKALYVAIVIKYRKLFAQAKGRKIVLNKDVFNSDEQQNIHKFLISIGNEYVAHSGKEGFEKADHLLLLDSNRKRRTPPRLKVEVKQPVTMPQEYVSVYSEHVDYLMKYGYEKYYSLKEKVSNEICNTHLDTWYDNYDIQWRKG